jgi:acetyl esterase/lipase
VRADEPAAPAYDDHRRVMYYRDDQGQEQPVRSSEDWAIRRRHILAGVEQAMGPLPDVERLPPLDVQFEDSAAAETDRYTRRKLSYAADGHDRVPAWLLVPKGLTGPAPAMVCLHQTTNIGKDEVAGLGGLPNLHYGHELAERGYVVIAPDYPSLGEYAYDFDADPYASGSMKGIVNHIRAVDLLRAQPQVDADRIGAIGHSLGGHNAIFLGVFDERVRVVVSSCGWNPFHDYYGGQIRGWSGERYMPRFETEFGLDPDRVPFDFYELIAALAPRAFFSCSPLRDENFDVVGVKKAIPAAAEVYALFDAADRLQVRYPDCEHDFPPDVRREAYELIDRVLEHAPPDR